ncbi:hypothetical protein DENSPDRAFT_632387 [Dentipellis sp. KUC8613]|nr:hypothetical protein DENSPDRAFT_632387 [Dentipellis sp. KUC8613]
MLHEECSWEFQAEYDGPANEGISDIVDAINASTALLRSVGQDALAIAVPPNWLAADRRDETLATEPSKILSMYNGMVMARAHAKGKKELFVPYTKSETDRNAAGSVDSNAVTDTIGNIIPIQKILLGSHQGIFSVDTMMAALTIGRSTTEIGSEMSVERHIGRLLRGVFVNKDCDLLENDSLVYPTILGLWASAARPAFACRLRKFGKNSPVVLLGEAKKDFKKDMPVAQLACAVQPTLQLFVACLRHKHWKAGRWSADWNPLSKSSPAQIPAWMRIHGMCYDRRGFTFHVFFPQYRIRGNDVIWNFVCRTLPVAATEMLRDVFRINTMVYRAELLKVLCLLKSEALKTADHIHEELVLPNCLVALQKFGSL